MSEGFIAKRPWLLVWVAFVVLIATWVVTVMISRRAPSDRLTPAQEQMLLRGKGVR